VHSRNFTSWKQDVDMLVDAGNLGKQIVAMTKTWTSGTQAQKDDWHKFALASFMLGTDGNSMFCFTYDSSIWTAPSPFWDNARQLGAATGAYFTSSSLYERNYQNGIVVVNPTATATTFNFSGTYKKLDGTSVTGSLVMPAYSGEALWH